MAPDGNAYTWREFSDFYQEQKVSKNQIKKRWGQCLVVGQSNGGSDSDQQHEQHAAPVPEAWQRAADADPELVARLEQHLRSTYGDDEVGAAFA